MISGHPAECLNIGWAQVTLTELSRAGEAVDQSAECIRRGGEVQIQMLKGTQDTTGLLHGFSGIGLDCSGARATEEGDGEDEGEKKSVGAALS